MSKIDYKKELKHLYNPSAKTPAIVDVPKMNFLMIDGAGDPSISREFQEAVEALFSVSYMLKFMIKKQGGPDYGEPGNLFERTRLFEQVGGAQNYDRLFFGGGGHLPDSVLIKVDDRMIVAANSYRSG